MIAHDVAAAHRGKTDGRRVAFAGYAFTAIDRTSLQVAPERLGDDLPMRNAVPEGASILCR